MPDLDEVKSLRLSELLLRAARYRARIEHIDESTALRHIIALGSEEYACRLYQEGTITLREASAMAGHTLWEMMNRMSTKGIKGNLTSEDTREGIKTAIELARKESAKDKESEPWIARDRGERGYRRSRARKRKGDSR